MTPRARADRELLHDLAEGDMSVIGPLLADRETARRAAGLDDETFELLEIVALAAMDASATSWFVQLGTEEPGVEFEKVVGALIAVAPIIGVPRLVSAAGSILGATRLAEELEEEVL